MKIPLKSTRVGARKRSADIPVDIPVRLRACTADHKVVAGAARNAGFQPAASPISNRQTAPTFEAHSQLQHLQAGSPARQQVGNLRYELPSKRASFPQSRQYPRAGRQECRRSAFSLIELMIVVIVIGIIAATIAPRIVGTTHDARVSSAEASVTELANALERFYIHMDRYPSNEEGLNALVEAPPGSEERWRGPYIERLRPDPWGNAFQYRIPGSQNRAFDLWSRGSDGVDGGEGKGADIGNW